MSAETTTLFHFDSDRPSFEDIGKANGVTHWREEDVRDALGYESVAGFDKAINRAKQACLSLGLDCEDHFVRQPDGQHLLTRFACYLIAMNGDPRKSEVAAAQAYFATLADTFQSYLDHADGIDRLLIRDEIKDGQKSLASTAKRHGVTDYACFQNKGFMGMYNMSLIRLGSVKGIGKGEKLIDRMGKAEMAAHLFRITQTDEKIKNEGIHGQTRLENAAYKVGQTVRQTVIEISGKTPESLPPAEHVNDVRKKIKAANKSFKAIDGKKRKGLDDKSK